MTVCCKSLWKTGVPRPFLREAGKRRAFFVRRQTVIRVVRWFLRYQYNVDFQFFLPVISDFQVPVSGMKIHCGHVFHFITFVLSKLALYNFYDKVASMPDFYRQLNCRGALITLFNCPLENKFADMWSHHNYITYVMEGRKIWHTAHGSYDLQKGSCVFVRKGACIVEQFFDAVFCIVLFFIPDDFICDTLKSKSIPLNKTDKKFEPVIAIERNQTLDAFFHSMMPYFGNAKEPDPALLELKFRELILTIADDPANKEMLSYFCSLLHQPQAVSLQRIMEDNYCFNLKLEEYAQLSNRSLSAFKRDFQKQFDTTPGKWLLEKRLNHGMHLISNASKTVSEAAFESGFENPSHFSRSFRQHFGMAPTAVKQQVSI